MNSNIKISIPTPCHENWAAMSPTDKGRFCASCQKQVMDFTRMGDSEIAGILKKDSNVCARIKPAQADRQLIIPLHRKNHVAALATVAILAASPAIAYAQTQVQTEQQPVDSDHEVLGKVMATPVNVVHGTVVDENNEPLQGASIILKGTLVYTSTDIDGKFSIQANNGDILQVMYVAHGSLEATVGKQDFTKPLRLRDTSADLKGLMIIVKERTFFGRVFYRIGNIFR